MSMILDALRKSEAERRRAQAPDLFAEPVAVAQPRNASQSRWLWWLLAAVAAVLVAWLARGVWSPTAGETGTEAIARAKSEATRNLEPVTTSASAPAMRADAATPASSARVNARPIDPDTTTSSPPPAPLSAALATPQPEPAPPTTTPNLASLPALPAAEPVAPPPPPASAVTASVNPTGTLRLADLSTEERQQLPTLKMSMHMWNPAAAQRFVILDGTRLGEGDRIGDAVIDEIAADGVVLAWHGHRLKLPIR